MVMPTNGKEELDLVILQKSNKYFICTHVLFALNFRLSLPHPQSSKSFS